MGSSGLLRCKAITAAVFRSNSKARTRFSVGDLPAHTTFDLAAGRSLTPGRGTTTAELGVSLIVQNILNHQYPIKVANGFNTTQIANGTNVLFRLSAPF